jgi:spermidine/putrescine transport system permease protein
MSSTILRAVRSKRRKLGVGIGPSLVYLLLLVFAPITFIITVSFLQVDDSYQIVFDLTLENYRSLFSGEGPFWESTFFSVIVESLTIAVLTTLLTLILAFPLAYHLSKAEGVVFQLMLVMVLLPFFTVYLVRVYSWLLMFGKNGVINNTLMTFGLTNGPVELFNYGIPAIIIGLIHAFFPYMLFSVYASLDGFDFALVDAARDLGAGRVETFRDIVIPITLPGIITGCLFVFVPSFGAFVTPLFLGQGKVLMIGQLIESRISSLYAIDSASAISMFIILAIVIAFGLAFRHIDVENLGGV